MTGTLYKIGCLTRTHGVRGELAMSFTDDVWDRADADYVFLEVEGLPVPFFLEEWRFRNDTTALMKFRDIDDADRASEFVGCDVYFPEELTPVQEEDEMPAWRRLTGWQVVDCKAGCLGCIGRVDDSTANVVFEVNGILIPAAEPLIERIDAEGRTVYMRIPEGLLDL